MVRCSQITIYKQRFEKIRDGTLPMKMIVQSGGQSSSQSALDEVGIFAGFQKWLFEKVTLRPRRGVSIPFNFL
jgi:hypothetical protein